MTVADIPQTRRTLRSRPPQPRTPRVEPAQLHLVLMLVLTFSSGVIDAVGYLGLDRVFTANMTGNVVILGMALVGAAGLPVLGPAVALAGFAVGAAIAGRLLRGAKSTVWTGRTSVVFAVVSAALVVVAIVAATPVAHSEPTTAIITTVIAVSMGLQAAAARHIAAKDVTTVVVTSTLTGLAADSIFGARTSNHPWIRRLSAIALIGAGAAVGALCLWVGVWLGVALSALLAIVVTAVGHATRRASQRVGGVDG